MTFLRWVIDALGPGRCERYIIGGTNETNLFMQQQVQTLINKHTTLGFTFSVDLTHSLSQIAALVNVPAPTKATPGWLLQTLAKWNEVLKLLVMFR